MSDQYSEHDYDTQSFRDSEHEYPRYAPQAHRTNYDATNSTQARMQTGTHNVQNMHNPHNANNASHNAYNTHGTHNAHGAHANEARTRANIPQVSNTHTSNTNARTNTGHTRVTAPQPYQTNHINYANNADTTSARPSSAYHQNYVESDLEYNQATARQSSGSVHKIAAIIASIVYWPIAIIGVSAPFLSGFNHGNLHMWQTVFSRFWLAFALLGFIYALVINLGGIRMSSVFDGNRPLKIAIAIIADIALSFVLIRIICFF